ncbi:MAG: O-antigen ligase family protein [Pseudomonadota bacterium]
MPEYIRALVVILVLASVVFGFAKAPATAVAISTEDFVRRRNVWVCITLAGFLSQNYWIFCAIVSLLIFNAAKKESNKIAMFFFLVLVLPQIRVEIPGFAGIRYFFEIDYVRILTAIVLFPVCVKARKLAVASGAKANLPDKILATYIVLNLVLQAQHDMVTGVIRSMLNWGIDAVVPYYAISRSLKDLKSFRDVLMSFAIAAMVVSLVGAFEFARHWILYSSAGDALGVEWNPGYLARGDLLRASGTSGQSIVFGYVLTIAIGFFLFLQKSVSNFKLYAGGMLLLVVGVISPLSRGPWVGLIVILFVFTVTGAKPLQRISKFVLFAVPASVLLTLSEYGQKVIDYLPFIGSVDKGNVTYRQNLFDKSLQIILDNPFFGSTDYLIHLEELRQGQGIIDLVNTFLIVALNTGFVGLGLYVLFFLLILLAAFRRMRLAPLDSELRALGRSMLAVLIGVLVIIGTVSPINHVPLLLWSVAAMCLAFGLLKQQESSVLEKQVFQHGPHQKTSDPRDQ